MAVICVDTTSFKGVFGAVMRNYKKELQQAASLVVGRIVKHPSSGSNNNSQSSTGQLQQLLPSGATTEDFSNYFNNIYSLATGNDVCSFRNQNNVTRTKPHAKHAECLVLVAGQQHPSDKDIEAQVVLA